jgi:hypothetical protein
VKNFTRVCAVSLGLFVTSLARADVLEHGYVEPCTLSSVEETHLECEVCTVTNGAGQGCSDRLAPRGFEKRCRTHGKYHQWEEIWCADLRLRKSERRQSVSYWIVAGLAAVAALSFLVKRRLTKRV